MRRRLCLWIALAFVGDFQSSIYAQAAPWKLGEDFVKIDDYPGAKLDIRYATNQNFVGKNLYGDFHSCYLHKDGAAKLGLALQLLRKEKPGYSLLLFDCLRPRRVQRILFDVVKGTAQEGFVANPASGSVHNYGLAVDLSLADENGRELDMGTPFDDFTDLARPDKEDGFLQTGKLSESQVANRRLLRRIMTEAGFIPLPFEWWHFDSLKGPALREKYKIVE